MVSDTKPYRMVKFAMIVVILGTVFGIAVDLSENVSSSSSAPDKPALTPIITPFQTVSPQPNTSNLNNLYIFYEQDDHLYVKSANPESEPVQVLTDPLYSEFSQFTNWWNWSDKADALVTAYRGDLYTFAPRDNTPRILLESSNASHENFFLPQWSPDGKDVAFIENKIVSDSFDPNDLVDSLMVYNLSNHMTKIILGPYSFLLQHPVSFDSAPAWSPDGLYIAYGDSGNGFTPKTISLVSTACLNSPNTPCNIAPLAVTDGSYQPLTDPNDLDNWTAPAWSPDGKQLAFECSTVCLLNRDGSNFRRLPGCLTEVQWSPDSSYLACDSKDGIDIFDVKQQVQTTIAHIAAPSLTTMQIFGWLPATEATTLESAPTPIPSPTISSALQIKPTCSENSSLTREWIVTNDNTQDVVFTLQLYDKNTNAIQAQETDTVPKARNGLPGTVTVVMRIHSGSNTVRILVNGVLQASSDSISTQCPRPTPQVTTTASPLP